MSTKNTKKQKTTKGGIQTNNNTAQQGDVLLRTIDALPTGLSLKEVDSKIVQYGEVTGHNHNFRKCDSVKMFMTEPAVDNFIKGNFKTITDLEGEKFIQVERPALLRHTKGLTDERGDHHIQLIMPGIRQLDIVRTWDYDSSSIQSVVD